MLAPTKQITPVPSMNGFTVRSAKAQRQFVYREEVRRVSLSLQVVLKEHNYIYNTFLKLASSCLKAQQNSTLHNLNSHAKATR